MIERLKWLTKGLIDIGLKTPESRKKWIEDTICRQLRTSADITDQDTDRCIEVANDEHIRMQRAKELAMKVFPGAKEVTK